MPAGGSLVAAMLERRGVSVVPRSVPEPEQVDHLWLVRSGGGVKGRAREGLSVGNHAGITKGNYVLRTRPAPLLIVCDEGIDTLEDAISGSEEKHQPLIKSSVLSQAQGILWAARRTLPDKELFEQVKDRCTLMITADTLRAAGALISRQVSWERTATDLMWQLKNNPKFDYLHGARELIVTFAEDGAAHLWWAGREGGDGLWVGSLTLTNGGYEGEAREKSGLDIPDTWSVTVARVAQSWRKRFEDDMWPGDRTIAADDLNAMFAAFAAFSDGIDLGVPVALDAAATLLETGYDPTILANGDYGAWLDAGSHRSASFTYNIPFSRGNREADPDHWCIAASLPGSKIHDIAYNYVLDGPSVIDGIPRFTCGALTTVDRQEIESFQNVRNLIVGYAASNAIRPLSIAVFGAPGSGKSFGVTQIAKNVLPNVEKLEFNVSQFVSREDLAAGFHRVRDVILEGKLPLVFFDEFDSDRDGQALGWLKSFLMPMQDGKFRDSSGEHPIGKCVMVFAGGTSSTFESFCQSMTSEDSLVQADFKAAKGPDFVSRLRGTIDVLGPNPASDQDRNFLLRRALLLRSLLERKLGACSGRALIAPDVLHAMLHVPTYRHGARSMESILDMSQVRGGSWEPAALPFYTQLSLHVDADAFIGLVLKDVVLNAYREVLARAIHEDSMAARIHENYVENHAAGADSGSSYGGEWDSLPDEIKDSNRTQALSIPDKLLLVRCGFDAGDTPYPTLTQFTDDEVLLLAQDEHERWMEDKRRNGWTYGPVRDNEKKIHPCLVSWEKLPENEQQKDRDVALNIIPLLKKAGLRVYRMV
jgi:hypothetical protein